MSAPTFTAKYRGACGACDERINPGDEVTYVGQDLEHAECPTLVLGQRMSICGRCFMELPMTGACPDCD